MKQFQSIHYLNDHYQFIFHKRTIAILAKKFLQMCVTSVGGLLFGLENA